MVALWCHVAALAARVNLLENMEGKLLLQLVCL